MVPAAGALLEVAVRGGAGAAPYVALEAAAFALLGGGVADLAVRLFDGAARSATGILVCVCRVGDVKMLKEGLCRRRCRPE